jgi:succinate dehydrogenase / fumarate reductase cytochrome b subunit
MVSSILHRVTGILNAVGSLIIVWGLASVAAGPEAFGTFKGIAGSPFGTVVMIGWTLNFFYHLCNGIRHLAQDAGAGYAVVSFVRSSWLAIVAAIVLTALVWGYVLMGSQL